MERRKLTFVLLLHCALINVIYGLLSPTGGSGGSGSGSAGSGMIVESPPECTLTSLSLTVSVFDHIIDELTPLGCNATEGDSLMFQSSAVGLNLLETDTTAIFGDYFESTQDISLDVCSSLYDLCVDVNISVTISDYTEQLLPFGHSFSDESVANADDRAAAIFLPRSVPFGNKYYDSIYLSTNGLLSFGQPFTQWWPTAFPYGRSSAPLLAPYWNDLDFRNDLEDSGLYYHTYVDSGSKRDESFLQEFSDRLDSYSGGDSADFDPDWMVVATWYKATPYYGRSNQEETLTFQLVLASDSVDTYAFFLYEEGGLNWNRDHRQIVVGYDSKNYIDYLNVVVNDTETYLQLDSIEGNTGSNGEWYFKLTDSEDDTNYELECFKWAAQQNEDVVEDYFEGLPACPCTRQQARRDWRFWFGWRWGLSSGPNCATLVWSGRQSTTECCYDDNTGALLVGPNAGGSFKLYHPWFSNRNYVTEDQQPHEHCCQLSNRCSTFYTHRPSDNCSGYDPSAISFTWGDPHFRTIDNNTYTFNALGEYVLLRSNERNMNVQVRLRLFDPSDSTSVNATVISALVVEHGSVQLVQVEEGDQELLLYVNGSAVSLPESDDSNLIVTADGTYDSFNSFIMSEQDPTTTDYISIRYDESNLIIVLSSGASVMVSSSSSFLHAAVEVSSAFINNTEGLLGYFNGDPSDDFYLPNGTIVPDDSSEAELYYYGLEWHVGMRQSLFQYFNGESYDTYNNEWNTFVPIFTDELTQPADAIDVCEGNDPQCIFDYTVTGDVSIAIATHSITTENQDIIDILGNHPPDIDGPLEIYITTGVNISESYSVQDRDGHDIAAFTLEGSVPEGFSLNIGSDGITAQLVWTNPGSELPAFAVQLFANDSQGASTVRNISVVLCACANNGTCVNTTTPQYNSNGHYSLPCLCPDFFFGDLCEVDARGCSDNACPEFSVCMDNDSVPEGYTCTDCEEGYYLDDEGKCSDINECNTTDPQYRHNCTHICINTDGGYECQCMDGYELGDDDASCADIDECYDRIDDCREEQRCDNTGGSFTCSCYPPQRDAFGQCLEATCSTMNLCEGGSLCLNDIESTNQHTCICKEVGKYCEGTCSGDAATLTAGDQNCSSCPPNMYGYRCKKVCDCDRGECDPVEGCVCDPGVTGARCDTEINQADPEFADDTITKLTLSWNLPTGALLAGFNATDSDDGSAGEVVFSLSHSAQLPAKISSGEGVFTLGNTTGYLVLAEDLNTTQGMYTQFVLTVVASDLGEYPRSSQVIVSVTLEDTPAPIPNFSENVYEVRVSEDTVANTTILNLTCTEPEDATGTSNLTTTLTKSNDSTLFSLEGDYNDLMVVLVEEIDYESLSDTTTPHYSLTLVCTNQYNISTSASIEVEIVNVDDNPFAFDNDTYSVSVAENLPRYYEVLTVSAFDPDIPDGEILYNLANPGTFNIYPTNGTVYVSNPSINRETRDNYTLTVKATLNLDQTTQAMINITITDINENPPIFSKALYTSDNITTGNNVGDAVLTVVAEDYDYEKNGSVVYSLEANPLFAINSDTGLIFINSSNIRTLYGSYILDVYASDEGDPPKNSSSIVDIYVAPSPERIEFQNLTSSLSIPEDQPRGSTIGSVLAVVIDQSNGTVDAELVGEIDYTLVGVNVMAFFTVSKRTGEIILLTSLDFETQHSYILQIEASIPEQTSLQSVTATVEIDVTDVNDNAPLFSPSFYAVVVEEFTPPGTQVLSVSASDRDSGVNKNFTFQLETGISVPFSIDPITGEITVDGTLDTPRDYRFDVVVTDSGTPSMSSEAVVFISVTRSASVVPEFDRQIYTFNVSEGAPIGTQIGTVVAHVFGNNTIDQYTHLYYRIQMPDMNMSTTFFHIDGDLGNVSILTQFDAESQDQYAFYVEVYNATNQQQVFDRATVEVHVTDENDNTPMFLQSLYTSVITTAQPPNSTLLTVSARDRDESNMNSQFDFSLVSDTLGFDLLPSGHLKVVNSTLSVGEYHMTALATDRGSPARTGSATVFVAIIPADPQNITFEQSAYSFEVYEDTEPGVLVGRIVALDHNNMAFPNGSGIRYSTIADPNVTNCVHIGEFNGELQVSCTLDREREASYTFVVTAELGNETGQVGVTVNILDINDNTPVFTRDVYARVVGTMYGNLTTVLSVHADDLDFGENATIEYTFEGGQTEDSLFRIVPTSGDIFFLDREVSAGDYRLTVVASDSGTPTRETASAAVFICVIHEQPGGHLQVTTTVFSIAENSPTGAIVGTVQLQASGTTISHENYQDNLEFLIVGGDSEDLFFINRENGTLQVVGMLDREGADSHVVEVQASFRDYGLYTNASITIRVLDVNDNSPIFNPSIISTVIDDGYMYNDTVPNTNLYATDSDQGTNAELAFSISEVNPFGVRNTSFSPGELQGEIYIQNASLLSPGMSYSFSIIATDGGIPSQSSSATILITVEHVLPERISFPAGDYTFNHTENSNIQTPVGTVSIEQDTPALDELIYSVSGGTGMFVFSVDPYSGTIHNLMVVDREEDTQFELNVTAYLRNEPNLQPTTTTVVINILDENDNIPVFNESSYAIAISTDEVDTSVPLLTVSASDQDVGSNAQLGYSIDPDNQFSIDQTGQIFPDGPLQAQTYLLTITATDMGSTPLSGSALVVVDIREAVPHAISFNQSQYIFYISEYTSSGSVVGRVELDPPVPSDFEQYIIFSADSADFLVASQSGVIRSLRQFDHETDQSNIDFEVTCRLDLPHENPPVLLDTTADVTVYIVDENDNQPQFVNFPATLQYPENRTQEEEVTQIMATDEDSGTNGMLYFDIPNDQDETYFRIDHSTGRLFVQPGLDREQQEQYNIVVLVKDQGNPELSTEGVIVFTLEDINDNQPVLNKTVFSVDERVTGNVFDLEYRDSDIGDNAVATFHLITGGDSRFTVITSTGVVRLNQELDYETEPTVELTVQLQDNPSGPSNTPEYTITVNVINQPDNVPQFEQTMYTVNIDPRISTNELILTVSATDEDGDGLTYSISSVTPSLPGLDIGQNTGRLFFNQESTLTPDDSYDVILRVTDDSEYLLSSVTTVVINISPETLMFEEESYSVGMEENRPEETTVATLTIEPLSQSSGITFSYIVTSPSGSDHFHSVSGNDRITIKLSKSLDRESIPSYTLEVMATRGSETAAATLTVTVEDVNDNPPVISPPNSSYPVPEDFRTSTPIIQVMATDSDAGSNGKLVYSLDPGNTPFEIDSDNGDIRVTQTLDYETQSSYTLDVEVRDSASQPRSATVQYIVEITNVNDNAPSFSAPAYFGELYSDAPNNIRVHHVILGVTDEDGEDEVFSFSISLAVGSQASGYELRVNSGPPYFIIAAIIPENAASEVIEFNVEVSDGVHSSSTILYLSVYSQEHLITLTLTGVSKEDFLSCSDPRTSLCIFRESLSLLGFNQRGQLVSYYNDTVEESETDTQELIVRMYGWYGDYGPRLENGEEQTNQISASVKYLTYTTAQLENLAVLVDTELNSFDFGVELVTSVEPTTTTTDSGGIFDDRVIVGIICGTVLIVLVIGLVVVLVVIFGRRRAPKAKRRDRDPYDLNYPRNRRTRRGRSSERPNEKMVLTSQGASSDLAYETMYDDDEILGQPQTMPWFDPNYLAPAEGNGYDGDVEPNSPRTTMQRQAPLRATVDGDARRNRRHSSDESAGGESVTELDRSRYLQQYQRTTPMQPGQRMGEYDMFANARDPERPYRPSLQSMPGFKGQQGSQA